MGSFFFEETITGQTYLQMLKIVIPRLIENKNEVYFQQDRAPPFFEANTFGPHLLARESGQGHSQLT